MPELPEVETVRRGLEESIIGRRIMVVKLNRPDLRTAFPENFVINVKNSIISRITRRAKYLLLWLDNGRIIILHLGMSGQLRVMPIEDYEARPHDHVVMDFDDGQRMVFRDPRRFGLMTLADATDWQKHPLFAHLGPEPLEAAFSTDYLTRVLAARKASIKATLMDQAVVVGVGNIYACEALFRSKINPLTRSCDGTKEAGLLIEHIRNVLQEAIAFGGSTLRDYVRSSGDMGYFQHHFSVYGREGKPCPVCSTAILRQKIAGRSTYFCKTCQCVD